MQSLEIQLKSTPLVYATRDLERALGLPLTTKNYYVVTNATPYARPFARKHKNVLLVNGKAVLDTSELLTHHTTTDFINRLNSSKILVFKNTTQIEKICLTHGWALLNPKAALTNHVEEKISQIKWLGHLTKYLPPHRILLGKELPLFFQTTHKFNITKHLGDKFILQFNRAHTGSGTLLITSKRQLNEIADKFPNREARLTKFIDGPIFTVNSVVWGNDVLVGNISYQITGLPQFTDQPFATIGNDWALPAKLLSSRQSKQIRQIATDIGKRLARDGWKGLFGIDVIVEEATGRVFLIEINARQAASVSFESQLQQRYQVAGSKHQVSVFEVHLAALLGILPTPYSLLPITSGAQIVQRVTSSSYKLQATSYKLHKRLTFIPYSNTTPGADLLRIQSEKGIMKNHNEFNEIGKIIIKSFRN